MFSKFQDLYPFKESTEDIVCVQSSFEDDWRFGDLTESCSCCHRRWGPFILCGNIQMFNLFIQNEFSAHVFQFWVFKLMFFTSLLYVVFTDQLEGSLESLFQKCKKKSSEKNKTKQNINELLAWRSTVM